MVTEIEQFCEEAMRCGATNPTVLALVGQIHLYFNFDASSARQLSLKALKINPGNPIAHTCHSMVLLRDKQFSEALYNADQGLSIIAQAPGRHWWYMGKSLAHLADGNYSEAIRHAEYADQYSHGFRPPLRHLYALYLKNGSIEKARSVLQKLRKLEPGFSLAQIRENDQYPAGMLRVTGLVDQTDLT